VVKLRDGAIDETIYRVLENVAEVAFFLYAFLLGIFVVSAAASALRSGVLARWLAWVGVALGGAAILLGAIAPAEGWSIPPMMLSLVWIIAVSVSLIRHPVHVSASSNAVL